MLGGHAGVTDSTVLQYLGIVEQRTNELLQLQAFIQAKVEHTMDLLIFANARVKVERVRRDRFGGGGGGVRS